MIRHGFIIGQAPPKTEAERPFGRTKLYQWFDTIGIDPHKMSQFFDFGALTDTFPGLHSHGGHRVPKAQDIAAHLPVLTRQIQENNYALLIPVGKMAIASMLAMEEKHVQLQDMVGRVFHAPVFGMPQPVQTIIPLPHPSGASTWVYQKENRHLLETALALIKEQLPVS